VPRTREGVNVIREVERMNDRREYKAGAEGRERFVREMEVLSGWDGVDEFWDHVAH
jgi:hypothetical protein